MLTWNSRTHCAAKMGLIPFSKLLHQCNCVIDKCSSCVKEDGLSEEDMGLLLDTFPDQPLDFYGALRSATYDNQIRRWIERDVIDSEITNEDANLAELSRRLVNQYATIPFDQVCCSDAPKLDSTQQLHFVEMLSGCGSTIRKSRIVCWCPCCRVMK